MGYKIAGPWRIEVVRGGTDPVLAIKDANDNYVAKAHTHLDGCLIAAAPDLLAALETLLADFHSGVGLRNAISDARAAIARAKGIEKKGVYPTADEIEEEIGLRARGISY